MATYNDVSSARNIAAVDLSTTDATYTGGAIPRCVFVGGAGDVKVDACEGGTATFTMAAGTYLMVQPSKIYKTGTTATLMVALW